MQKLANWIFFRQADLTHEERVFTDEWLIRNQMNNMIAVAKFCRWMIPIFVGLMFSTAELRKIWIELSVLITLSIISWAMTSIRSLTVPNIQALISVASVFIFVGSNTVLYQTFQLPFDPESTIVVTQTYIVSLIFNIRIFPYRSALILPWAGIQVAAAAFAFSSNPELKVPDLIAELVLVSGLAVGLYYSWMHRLHSEAILEYRARQILIDDETSKQKSLQMDIKAAEAKTENDRESGEKPLAHDLTLSLFQRRFSALGGDWGAYKTFADGTIVIVVADATGKGIQAALVIQALKTMWATIQDQQSLSPIPWLTSVNKVFFQLGHRRDHTMTLGLLVIEPKFLTYYSAGHVPAFAIKKGTSGVDAVETVVGRGTPLGLKEELNIEPVRLEIDVTEIAGLMLGTDGIFDRGVRTRKRDIVKLQQTFAASGEAALDDLPRHDDQLVVWLHKAA